VKTLSILGLGAFGQLMAQHLVGHVKLMAYDPAKQAVSYARQKGIAFVSLEEAARADLVVIATPIDKIAGVVDAIKPHIKPGAIVLDVASVKVLPAKAMETLPDYVDIICTHPLFGPQSARNGIVGLKIAVCPIRGDSYIKVAEFFRSKLGLEVIMTTPEEHDREVAAVQGLTHMIAKVLVEMEPLPKKMTTVSFDLLMAAVELVRYDSMELFLAIERDNPFSAELRHKFFTKGKELRDFLESHNTSAKNR